MLKTNKAYSGESKLRVSLTCFFKGNHLGRWFLCLALELPASVLGSDKILKMLLTLKIIGVLVLRLIETNYAKSLEWFWCNSGPLGALITAEELFSLCQVIK